MKKILTTILIITMILCTSSVFATVSGENESGYNLTVDLSLTLDEFDKIIENFKNNLNCFKDIEIDTTIYNSIDKYYLKRAYETNLETFENNILSTYLSSTTENSTIDKKNIICFLSYNLTNNTYKPVFNFTLTNNAVGNVVDNVKFYYSSTTAIRWNTSSKNKYYTITVLNENNEYSEKVYTPQSNVTTLNCDTSKINISITSDSIIDIPTLYGVTNVMPVIYYKTQNESTYYPYILKNYNNGNSGDSGQTGEDSGNTGDNGSEEDNKNEILGEIKGEIIYIKDDVVYIKENILTKEKLQEVLQETVGDIIYNEDGTINDEESSGIVGKILSGIYHFFIPRDDFFEDYFVELNDWFSDRLGFLYYPIDFLINLLNRLYSSNYDDVVLTIPAISIPFFEDYGPIFEGTTFNFNTFIKQNEKIEWLYNIYLIIIDGSLIFGFLSLLYKKLEEVMTK